MTETENHLVSKLYPDSLVDLDLLIHREDSESTGVKTQFNNSLVIDLDCVERVKATKECRRRFSTMDCTLAIRDETETNMLLVELRLNYKNLQNLNRNKLIDKVTGSTLLLSESPVIHPEYIFIFKTELKSQARNRFYRMSPRISNNYIVMDINDLSQKYFKI